jgi:hypothetical protein
MRILIPYAVLLLAASPLTAQNRFRADLDGAQEFPPNASAAVGWGTASLNADLSVTYHVELVGLTGTSAHIHLGAPGTSGAIIAPLVGGPTIWSGTTSPFSLADAVSLRTGGTYFNVHTAAFPFGEIRGQILPSPSGFATSADGLQQTPPNASAATATGVFTVNLDRTLAYEIHATGIDSTATEIHIGEPGSVGPRIFNFGTGLGPWIGTTAPMSESDYELFQAGGTYLNIHSMAFFLGEIRGQNYSTGESFGRGCAGSGGYACGLSAEMVPYAGSAILLRIAGGEPGGHGLLGVATVPTAALYSGCEIYLTIPALFAMPVALDATGAAAVPLTLPTLPADRTFYLEFAGLNGGLAYTSNGLALTVAVL